LPLDEPAAEMAALHHGPSEAGVVIERSSSGYPAVFVPAEKDDAR
jgi:hypothetical protein